MAESHVETGFDVEIAVTDNKGRSRRYARARTADASADRDIVVARTGQLEFRREVFQDGNLPKTIVIAFENDGWRSFEYVLSE